jgi:hypothetical protein
MKDDWRLRIELQEPEQVSALTERMYGSELEHDLESSFHDRVAVSVHGPEVFCYAGTREQAERAASLIASIAEEHGWPITTELKHWHPVAEEWEDPDTPLPDEEVEKAAEHAQLIEDERAESAEHGPEFEVRIHCPSHHDTNALVERLRSEGIPCVHRWRYLVVGARDEDSANALAERLRSEVPAGCSVVAEASGKAVWHARPGNPFFFLGGLAG